MHIINLFWWLFFEIFVFGLDPGHDVCLAYGFVWLLVGSHEFQVERNYFLAEVFFISFSRGKLHLCVGSLDNYPCYSAILTEKRGYFLMLLKVEGNVREEYCVIGLLVVSN